MQLKNTNISYQGFMIPVRIGNHHASESASSLFSLACPVCADGGDMEQKYVCGHCADGVQYTTKDLRKKADVGDGQPRIFSQQQVRDLDGEPIIEVISAHSKDVIDMKRVTGSYVILPAKPISKKKVKPTGTLAKPWAVLKEALTQSNDCILVKFVSGGKERVGYITILDDEMTLVCTQFQDKYNKLDEKQLEEIPQVSLTETEIKSGLSMIEKLKQNKTTEEDLVDTRKERQMELILNGEPVEVIPEEAPDSMAFFAQV